MTNLPQFPVVHPQFWTQPKPLEQRFVAEVGDWRKATLDWLDSRDAMEQLSPQLIRLLRDTLTGFESHGVEPFPMESLANQANVEPILMWRARLVDFLSDVWDTFGMSEFTPTECGVAEKLLMPEDSTNRCPLCLLSWASDAPHRHYDHCPVQLRWRSLGLGGQQ